MSCSFILSSFPTISLILFSILLPITCSPAGGSDSSLHPNVIDCGPQLLPLTPCLPFVQGSVPTPVLPCCDNLISLYDEQPNCLCILLNGTAQTSFPINQTLALQLPALCHLEVNISTCPGLHVPPSSSGSQVSSGNNATTGTTVSPAAALAPASSILGIGLPHSEGADLKAAETTLALAIATLLLIEALY